MKSQTQISIQQRMREILIRLKGFCNQLFPIIEFQDYHLCLDRLDKLIILIGVETTSNQQERKKNNKEIKTKNNHLKEIKKELETVRQIHDQKQHQHQHTILTQKNSISELKRKIETLKATIEYYQYQKLKEENIHLVKELQEKSLKIKNLSEQKSKMITLNQFNALKDQLYISQKAVAQIANFSTKIGSLQSQNKQYIEKIEYQLKQIKRLQSIILTQNQNNSNNIQIIVDELDNNNESPSFNSDSPVNKSKDYNFQQPVTKHSNKKKKHRKHMKSHKYQSHVQNTPQQQQPTDEIFNQSEDELFTLPTPSQLKNNKEIKSFSLVMFFLAGVLALPFPGWN